jgi:hypothetical protein
MGRGRESGKEDEKKEGQGQKREADSIARVKAPQIPV